MLSWMSEWLPGVPECRMVVSSRWRPGEATMHILTFCGPRVKKNNYILIDIKYAALTKSCKKYVVPHM